MRLGSYSGAKASAAVIMVDAIVRSQAVIQELLVARGQRPERTSIACWLAVPPSVVVVVGTLKMPGAVVDAPAWQAIMQQDRKGR